MPGRAKAMRPAPISICAVVDQRPRDVVGAGEDVVGADSRRAPARPEMRLVEPPQRLHRDVERAGAEHGEPPALLHQRAQLRRRPRQRSRRVEPRDFALRPGEAEDAFVARDLGFDLADGAARRRLVGMPQRQLGEAAQDLALPVEQLARGNGGAQAGDHQRQAGGGRDDAERAPARHAARRRGNRVSRPQTCFTIAATGTAPASMLPRRFAACTSGGQRLSS